MTRKGVPRADYWARPAVCREQIVLFAPTLDEAISEDHTVRLFDESLRTMDWSAWEAHYPHDKGRPPIHPRVMASAILYGFSLGTRASRKLEYLISHNVDFIWLVEGLTIDYSTICKFRVRFKDELKLLFRQICQLAMRMGLIRLNQVALDGTRVRANNSSSCMATAETLQERLEELDRQIAKMFEEADDADKQEGLFDDDDPPSKLPPGLSKLQDRRDRMQQALEAAQKSDAARRKQAKNADRPARAPYTDPDSKVLPNKEGGFGVNYTPLATTDGERGFIVDTEVIQDSQEQATTLDSVDRIEDELGEKPQAMLADGLHATGHNVAGMEERNVDFYSPLESGQPAEDSPVLRDDLSQPVAEEHWKDLPRNSQQRLDRSAFVYDVERDVYWCPMGKELKFHQHKNVARACGTVRYRIYRCSACQGCSLASVCMAKNSTARTVQRDAHHEEQREAHATKMATEEAKEIYRRRMWIGETPFGVLKSVMGQRQFLLRGLEKVKTEWLWACTGFNLAKFVRELARLRRMSAKTA